MPLLTFIDANVLLRCFDDRDGARRDAARRWVSHCWTTRTGRTGVQSLHEFYAAARRQFPTAISAGDARAEVRRYQHWKPWQVDHPTVEAAWAIESRFELAYWDALIVASAQQQGCTRLISEDLPHALQIDNVQILSPYRSEPDAAETPLTGAAT